MVTQAHLRQRKAAVEKVFLAESGIASIGIGDGVIVIRVGSEADRPTAQTLVDRYLPDVPVEIRVSGRWLSSFTSAAGAYADAVDDTAIHAGQTTSRADRIRPIQLGTAIQVGQGFGTAGLTMFDADGQAYLVSANHVLAQCGLAGRQFVGQPTLSDPLGRTSGWTRPTEQQTLSDGTIVSVFPGDVAWAKADIAELSRTIYDLGVQAGPGYDPQPGDRIGVSSLVSGTRFGNVTEADVSVFMEEFCGEPVVISGTFIMDVEGQPGDSGSGVFYEDAQGRWRPSGILFGGSDTEPIAVATTASVITEQSGLSFTTSSEPVSGGGGDGFISGPELLLIGAAGALLFL